ncbi:hypothetical protein HPB50_014171 [Hyalomma asiaticum]|uniref:Uncharacterized protein n=1 Tax=Hyalomma asiaticum TaxID=266040 RepID=A0ACB7SED4_HYAAI|nr:hypothetical protein HPB50_014171 [Hyalomma asiaticum]
MVQALNASVPAGEGPFSVKQVRQKLENLNKPYRKLRCCGTTMGAKGIEWPFYWQLHAFLGSLPVNDSDLVEESLEMPVIDHAPEECVIVATTDTEESESATMETAVSGTSSAETPSVEPESSPRSSNKKKGKKRPASVALHDLLALHEKGEERAAKAASESLELKRSLLFFRRNLTLFSKKAFMQSVSGTRKTRLLLMGKVSEKPAESDHASNNPVPNPDVLLQLKLAFEAEIRFKDTVEAAEAKLSKMQEISDWGNLMGLEEFDRPKKADAEVFTTLKARTGSSRRSQAFYCHSRYRL